MGDLHLRELEHELADLRRLREVVVAILSDRQLDSDAKLQSLDRLVHGEQDEEDAAEEARDRERLS